MKVVICGEEISTATAMCGEAFERTLAVESWFPFYSTVETHDSTLETKFC